MRPPRHPIIRKGWSTMNRPLLTLATLLTLAITQASHAQEPTPRLDPPVRDKLLPPIGPVTGTMKTLDQVEPRTPANDLPGDLNWVIIISEPGSYYLTGNVIGVLDKGGIDVRSNDVTLDLNGFNIDGANAGDFRTGIRAGDRCVIRNGSLTNWSSYGLFSGNNSTVSSIRAYRCGSDPNNNPAFFVSSQSIVQDCHVIESGGTGIHMQGRRSIVERCMVSKSGEIGIDIGTSGLGQLAEPSTVRDCYSAENGEEGILAGFGASISSCTTFRNQSCGIRASRGSIVKDCVSFVDQGGFVLVADITAVDCTAVISTGDGFRSGNGSVLTRCRAIACTENGFAPVELNIQIAPGYHECVSTFNTQSGFVIQRDFAEIRDCLAIDNAIGIEIKASANDTLIDSCKVSDNTVGIQCDADSAIIRNNTLNQPNAITVTGTNNLIINNAIKGGPSSVTIAPGNKDAAIVKHPDDAGPLSNIAL